MLFNYITNIIDEDVVLMSCFKFIKEPVEKKKRNYSFFQKNSRLSLATFYTSPDTTRDFYKLMATGTICEGVRSPLLWQNRKGNLYAIQARGGGVPRQSSAGAMLADLRPVLYLPKPKQHYRSG